MNTLIKQTVYLPKDNSKTVFRPIDLPVEKTIRQEGYFFTTEELNQHISNVIKDALDTAAEKSKIKREETHEIVFKGFSGGNPSYGNKEIITCDKQSITNTFEQTFQKYKL